MTKDSIETTLNIAKDFSDLFTLKAQKYRPSPLKRLLRFLADKDNIYLASGLPRADSFPIEELKFKARNPISGELEEFQITKEEGTAPLNRAQQYGNGLGIPQLRELFYNLSSKLYSPKYKDWNVIPTVGNTDALAKTVATFLNRGDPIAVARWAYPTALETFSAFGLELLIVDIDDEGIVPESMERVVKEWNQTNPEKTCRFVYVVPCGQNPTGVTMSVERRHRFYNTCQQLDMLIFEDDPYYFLQLPDYNEANPLLSTEEPSQEYLLSHYSFNHLLPTLQSIDIDGRVLRFDSVAKYLAPGFRCGWVIAQQKFIDKLQYANELSCQFPSGYSQSILAQILSEDKGWGLKGLEIHLAKLRWQFHTRRDIVINELKNKVGKNVDFIPPKSGMFLWLLPKLPSSWLTLPNQLPTQETMDLLFDKLIESKVVLVPGSYFDTLASKYEDSTQEQQNSIPGAPYLRLCYTYADLDKVIEGVNRIALALNNLESN